MCLRRNLVVLGQLVLVLAFLCAPIADNAHAMRMQQGKEGNTNVMPPLQKVAIAAEHAPCHEAMMVSVEKPKTDSTAPDKKPCCPYKQCSPNDCLINFAVASPATFEMLSHIANHSRTFVGLDILPVSTPPEDRLRPPIS